MDIDAAAPVLLQLADEDLACGHVLTSVAGWGPELEINIALSSMGQDELGHARLYYSLAVGPDRDAINAAIYQRPADQLRASPLAWAPGQAWEVLVVKQVLYETADAARRGVLAATPHEELRAGLARMEDEERYHLRFWSTWLTRTAAGGADATARLQRALDERWHQAGALFDLGPAAAVGAVVPGGADALAAARQRWATDVAGQLGGAGLAIPGRSAAPLGAPDADAERDRALDEMRAVWAEAPGRW